MTQGQLAKAIAKEFFFSQVDAAAILARMTVSLQKGEWVYFKSPTVFSKTAVLKRVGMPQKRSFRGRRHSGNPQFSDDNNPKMGPLAQTKLPLMPLFRQVLRGML